MCPSLPSVTLMPLHTDMAVWASMMQCPAACVIPRCAPTAPVLEQQGVLFPAVSVRLPLFSQGRGGEGYHPPPPFASATPVSEQRWVLLPSDFGILVLLSQGGGGGAGYNRNKGGNFSGTQTLGTQSRPLSLPPSIV